ncbi:NADPH-dependent diflavin oxidoreductase 1 [Penicillium diatomitis]|uniref:NADPH-dependent diflavin oxidoreductase 1 n=1 Tax=Penicillium diatomitis TaxID=2819901 RepID=A0A9W9XLF3_9EURO|nr:NADPH-dependent diflavin oxidoreductase 1 [Penicillium diatomitis]KAJ5495043.1 NADPH-dependent diflavin oxidoreductase 1 [Penicillium diatomitis]
MNVQNTESSRSVLILYGTETGNAQEAAEELGAMTERLRFATHISEMNQARPEALSSYTFTILVVSTTGQGDLPANARAFWKSLLLKKLPPTFLKGVDFAVFGLGDTSYPKFNWAARKLYKRLLQLGANDIYPTGEADQQHPEGLEATFLPWMTGFKKHLMERHPLPSGQHPIPDEEQLRPKWILQAKADFESFQTADPQGPASMPQSTSSFVDHDLRPLPGTMTATLSENQRMTPRKHWQDVRRICLTVPELVEYAPGDMIAITPKTSPADVQTFIDLMEWNQQADQAVTLVPTDTALGPSPIPGLEAYPNLTLRSLLEDYLDIKAIPRRSFFSSIAHYTDDSMQKERLLEFTNPEYIDELWDYTSRPRRSILEVLHEFDSVKIPWQHAVSVLPIIRARQFSIASGGDRKRTEDGKTQFELLVAIVKYQTVIKRIREGVCTRYLSGLQPGSTLRVQLQPGGLNSSVRQLTAATVLIGPGTGIAPLRSLLWEKAALVQAFREQNPDARPPVGPTVLLYGGRNRTADFFFEDEWEQLSKVIPLQVLTAFSRDQQQKCYVQDTIRRHFSLFFRMLHDLNGSVYICGSSGRMPQAVREALIEAFSEGGTPEQGQAYTRAQAEEYLIGMEKSGRYKQETW